MNSKYLIYFTETEKRNKWLDTLMGYANRTRIGIVSNLLPIVGNLSVSENILLAAYYHHRTSYKEGIKMVTSDLKKYGMERHLESRSNQLNDFERLIVKYLQVKYLNAEWIVFVSPRRMFVAEYEERFHQFLRCEDIEKSVIIDHENHRHLFDDMTEYVEKDFDTWVTQDLRI